MTKMTYVVLQTTYLILIVLIWRTALRPIGWTMGSWSS